MGRGLALLAIAFAASSMAASARADDAGAPLAPAADLTPELESVVHAVTGEHSLEGASIGVAILDVASGRMLATSNEHLPLNPASGAKLYTAAAALAILHGDHKYETTLSGRLDGDAVAGLALRGYGDPSLTTADLATLVRELKGYGVKRVDGDILVDQRFYDEQTTPPAFEQEPNEWASFRAPISAVAVDENCVTMTVRPGGGAGSPARVSFEPPGFVDAESTVSTAAGGGAENVELALSGNGLRMSAKVSGVVAADTKAVRYTRRVEDPRLLAGYALKAVLESADVKVPGGVKLGAANGHVLAKHTSEPLSSLLYGLGKRSDNFYAEMIFRSLAGEAKSRPAKSAEAAEAVMHVLDEAGVSEKGVVIKNGSGLFDANRVTAQSTVGLLRWVWRDPALQPEYLAQLSVGGVDGTLHKRFRGEATRRRVRAKTGTLDDVVSLSGYVLRDGNRDPVAFSILFNHVTGKQSVARIAADRIVEHVAKWVKVH
jgi:D-alanyl-D-alanine carboxypeptidase/D-alanyl-D-alanine-endopeptidase (penicillin-binding protein 4)